MSLNSKQDKQRLHPWKNGQLEKLIYEGKTIQDRLQYTNRVFTNKNKEVIPFARLIEAGKVIKAIKILEKLRRG